VDEDLLQSHTLRLLIIKAACHVFSNPHRLRVVLLKMCQSAPLSPRLEEEMITNPKQKVEENQQYEVSYPKHGDEQGVIATLILNQVCVC